MREKERKVAEMARKQLGEDMRDALQQIIGDL